MTTGEARNANALPNSIGVEWFDGVIVVYEILPGGALSTIAPGETANGALSDGTPVLAREQGGPCFAPPAALLARIEAKHAACR